MKTFKVYKITSCKPFKKITYIMSIVYYFQSLKLSIDLILKK